MKPIVTKGANMEELLSMLQLNDSGANERKKNHTRTISEKHQTTRISDKNQTTRTTATTTKT